MCFVYEPTTKDSHAYYCRVCFPTGVVTFFGVLGTTCPLRCSGSECGLPEPSPTCGFPLRMSVASTGPILRGSNCPRTGTSEDAAVSAPWRRRKTLSFDERKRSTAPRLQCRRVREKQKHGTRKKNKQIGEAARDSYRLLDCARVNPYGRIQATVKTKTKERLLPPPPPRTCECAHALRAATLASHSVCTGTDANSLRTWPSNRDYHRYNSPR